MKLFLRVEPGHHLAGGCIVDTEDTIIQPGSLAIKGESAGAHQCRRRCSPTTNDDFAIDPHFEKALLRGVLAVVDKIAHVTPIESVVRPTQNNRPRIQG